VKHLVDGQPQDIAVHGRNAVQFPIDRMLLDDAIEFLTILQRPSNQWVGEKPGRGLVRRWRGQFDRLSPGGSGFIGGQRRGVLRLPKHLQRRLEILRRIQIVLKQKLDGAFARLTSLAHDSITMPQKCLR
jgi:hypothetical protein